MVNLSFPNLMQEQDEIPILADEFAKNELLAAENGIEDYNLIQVGQEIVIPLIEDEEE